jgi:bis(5'-nucleosyl)-tetraphosphatase (symmetrical)
MATFAIGDVQGCMQSLERLLSLIGYRPRRDRIWLAGDLVNRGPRSADVLRWAVAAGDDVVAVLGNHDLHLLGRAAGVEPARRRDTLDDVLDAPDAGELLGWLRRRPLLHREAGFLLVHAGVPPAWTIDQAVALAREAEEVLRRPEGDRLLGGRQDAVATLEPGLARPARLAHVVTALTRVRVVAPDGRLDLDFGGPPAEAPAGLRPWYELRGLDPVTLVFGHWSRLGLQIAPGHLALDTGCVYGNTLTAVRLEDRAVFQQPAVETRPG